LDEECNFPKGTDDTFLNKISAQHKSSSHYKKPFRSSNEFIIVHYAGEVSYNVEGFLAKNKDTVQGDLVALMQGSSDPYVKSLFPAEKESEKKEKKSKPVTPKAKSPSAKKITLGAQFRDQLKDLMATLSNTEPHFVRAIKPNNSKKANLFDSPNALRQLRYAGVLETIRIRSSGYAYRPTYDEFIERFHFLIPDIEKHSQKTQKQIAELILEIANLDKTKLQLGITKLFLREPQVYLKLILLF
jgi:myosin heavy subunit